VEPFTCGGLRRLVLNVNHPLILELAEAAAGGGDCVEEDGVKGSSGSSIGREGAIAMGEAMIWTGSWPMGKGMDCDVPVTWPMAKGLICGPHFNMVTPVPHQVVQLDNTIQDITTTADDTTDDDTAGDGIVALAIWPKRLNLVILKYAKSNPNKYVDKFVTTQGAKWKQRDDVLWDEWRYCNGGDNKGSRKGLKSISSNFLHFAKQHLTKPLTTTSTSTTTTTTTTTSANATLAKAGNRSYSSSSITPPKQPIAPIRLVTYAPSLPILVLAHYLQNPRRRSLTHRPQPNNNNNIIQQQQLNVPLSPRTTSLKTATNILLSTDRLFCLSLFFGVPLLDRTCTLRSALHLHRVVRCVPGRQEVEAYMNSIGDGIVTDKNDGYYVALEGGMMKRGETLWKIADGTTERRKKILVCWSGGIDSTAVLVCLLRTSSSDDSDNNYSNRSSSCSSSRARRERRNRLVVVCDDESIAENPTFYNTYLAMYEHAAAAASDTDTDIKPSSGLTIVRRDGRTLSELTTWAQTHYYNESCSSSSGAVVVTGELGDQLFGSDKCKVAFSTTVQDKDDDDDDEGTIVLTENEKKLVHDDSGIDKDLTISLSLPWEDTLLPMLSARGLLAGRTDEWKRWIAPQLAKSPIPILNLHDMLWWLNFSCKWQGVALRCLHDGGDVGEYPPLSPMNDGDGDNLTGALYHFYDDHALECWSCIPEFHTHKFGTLSDWKTYKEPLKRLIHSYHPDDGGYYADKEKVGSLCLELDDDKERRVESCAGLVWEEGESGKGVVRFGWGKGCATDYRLPVVGNGNWDGDSTGGRNHHRSGRLEQLLDPWILQQASQTSTPSSSTPIIEAIVPIDPWTKPHNYISPFILAPNFATTDERQRRVLNPITALTLEVKCAALLPPDMVKGRSVLDLGACLGAMCHWSLFHGASSVVAVETQENFCERMEGLLKGALHTWPTTTTTIKTSTNIDRKDDNNDDKEEKEGPNTTREERYKVVCTDVRQFLSQCQDQSYDIVIAAGLLHCFPDPISILLEAARVSRHALVIESINPPFQQSGARPSDNDNDGGLNNNDGNGNLLLEVAPSALVNKAADDASFGGLAVIPSKESIQTIVRAMGFDVSRVTVPSHPDIKREEDVKTYTGARRFQALPMRFFLRCHRRCSSNMVGHGGGGLHVEAEEGVVRLKSLEEAVISGKGKEYRWSDTAREQRWTNFAGEDIGVGSNSKSNQHHQPDTAAVDQVVVGSSNGNGIVKRDLLPVTETETHSDCHNPSRSIKAIAVPNQKSFISWKDVESLAHEVSYNASHDQYPYKVSAWGARSTNKYFVADTSTTTDGSRSIYYGYVFSGETNLSRTIPSNNNSTKPTNLTSTLVAGMFFCCPGACRLEGGSGVVISVADKNQPQRQSNSYNNRSMFTIGGPLETDSNGELTGALPYIDGCTDTILIHPQIQGTPCLNHLHFPPHIRQTRHTHPSGRVGIVIRGKGDCVLIEEGDDGREMTVRIPLRPGMVFVIPKDAAHAFETTTTMGNNSDGSCSTLDVVAFHPDSDYGPTGTDHPMVNRTMVGGVSASLIPSIQTSMNGVDK